MDNPVIDNKLKVFVSSAMGVKKKTKSSDSFDWLEIRKAVKDALNQCPYIQAFTIESHASEIPSTEYMLYNVEKSDIVVLIVKDEVRPGTHKEYIYCQEHKKPLLGYFFTEKRLKKSAKELKQDLITKDYCTFKQIDDIKNVGQIIANDVIQNVISYYQYEHYQSSTSQTIDIDAVPIQASFDNDSFIPTKTVLSQFKTSYQSIYKFIGMSDYIRSNTETNLSELHSIGEKAIEWVINGVCFLSSDVKSALVTSVTSIYPNTHWYLKRLDAIDFFIQGDLGQHRIIAKRCKK